MSIEVLSDGRAALAPWVALAVKAALLVAVAGLVSLALGRARAATRHFVWLTALCGVLLLPLLSPLPGLPAARWVSGAVDLGSGWWRDFVLTGNDAVVQPTDRASRESPRSPARDLAPSARRVAQTGQATAAWSVDGLLVGVWAAGLAILAIRGGRRRRALHAWRAQAVPVADRGLAELADEARRHAGLRRRPELLRAAADVMPMTWGWRHPVVLLPRSAERWSAERIRLVLRHEFAHIARHDCLTQTLAALACALHWFNPLVWMAAAAMRTERELACDDSVLADGIRPSTYAGHLLEIARRFQQAPPAAVAITRASGFERRLRAVLDGGRSRGPMRALTAVRVLAGAGAVLVLLGGSRGASAGGPSPEAVPEGLTPAKDFFTNRERLARTLLGDREDRVDPTVWQAFQAGVAGDWPALTKLYPAVDRLTWANPDDGEPTRLAAHPLKEAYGVYEVRSHCPVACADAFTRDVLQCVPAGSVYFGGTDAGRFLITAAVSAAGPETRFDCLTQNALADLSYLDYLRRLHSQALSVPTSKDLEQSFEDYMQDAATRFREGRLRPGEQVVDMGDGRIQIRGRTAVMQINAALARRLFEANPTREFYVEESWPLDWMSPHLSPCGLILKLNREPLARLAPEVVAADAVWWAPRVTKLIGDWLRPGTPVSEVADFVDRVYHRRDLSGFDGDRGHVASGGRQDLYGKPRTAIASLYQWRMEQATSVDEKERMAVAADFAYRQAFALAPASAESVARYLGFLRSQHRPADAQRIASSCLLLAADQGQLEEAAGLLEAAMK